jgi:hypothetical protein
MKMKEATLAIEHGILFVLDPTHKGAKVPDYSAGRLIGATRSCVSVATVPDVEGEVRVRLGAPLRAPHRKGCTKVFAGHVDTPGMRLAVVTANEKVFEVGASGERTHVEIAVDDSEMPALVCVSVG